MERGWWRRRRHQWWWEQIVFARMASPSFLNTAATEIKMKEVLGASVVHSQHMIMPCAQNPLSPGVNGRLTAKFTIIGTSGIYFDSAFLLVSVDVCIVRRVIYENITANAFRTRFFPVHKETYIF